MIGHETTHGFDTEGSKFDGHGNKVDWWTAQDRKKFDALADRLMQQYDQYTPIPDKPGLHVNGKLTQREDIADLGGLNIAYTALQNALKADPAEADQKIDGLTQDQRFFLNSARVWEGTARPKYAELALNVDPHAPAKIPCIRIGQQHAAIRPGFPVQAGREDGAQGSGQDLVTGTSSCRGHVPRQPHRSSVVFCT